MMKNDILNHKHLSERLPRFAEIAAELVSALNLEKSGGRGPKGEPASERVIRDYVRRRVLSPTLRSPTSDERGFYGFRHLVEFLAARVLLNDGWPLEKIAERNERSTTEELLALIPGQEGLNDAVALARSFQSRPPAPPRQRDLLDEDAQRGAPLQSGRPDPAVYGARLRAELPLLMRRLTGHDLPPRIGQLTRIELGSDLTLLIDPEIVRRITQAEAELIGRTVTAALLDYPNLIKHKRSRDDY